MMREWIFGLFLLLASWEDLRKKEIPLWMYAVFGGAGLLALSGCGGAPQGAAGSMWIWLGFIPGIVLLAISVGTRGAIGIGDGLFFLVAALFLPLGRLMLLLLYGILFSGACGMGIMMWGFVEGICVKKLKLPFLPFLLPAWLWMLCF